METSNAIPAAGSLFEKGKLFLKAVIIFVMAFFLWIPTHIIREVIKEREGRQKDAIEEVSSKWAGRQTITGPILMIPYHGTSNGIAYQKNMHGSCLTSLTSIRLYLRRNVIGESMMS